MTNGSKEMENGHQQNKRNLSGSSPKRKKKKIACKSEKQSEFLKQADKLPKKIIIRKRNFRLHHITACIWLWKIGVKNQFIHITDNSGEPKPNTFYHFAIEFDDFKNFIKSVIDKGVDVFDLGKERNKHSVNTNLDNQGRQFFVLDYDGNMIELVSAGEKFFNPQ